MYMLYTDSIKNSLDITLSFPLRIDLFRTSNKHRGKTSNLLVLKKRKYLGRANHGFKSKPRHGLSEKMGWVSKARSEEHWGFNTLHSTRVA